MWTMTFQEKKSNNEQQRTSKAKRGEVSLVLVFLKLTINSTALGRQIELGLQLSYITCQCVKMASRDSEKQSS